MTENLYETSEMLGQYLLFHYGEPRAILPWEGGPTSALDYPRRCVTETLDPVEDGENRRALDIGCAVGRSTFELARTYGEVIGLDFSAAFIDAAQALQQGRGIGYRYPVTGENVAEATAQVDADIDRSRVSFEVGDAQDLREDLGQFDVVLGANLICRLPEPKRFLDRLPSLVKPGGRLVLTTPQTWMEEYTPRENWLPMTTGNSMLPALSEALGDGFTLEKRLDMPFLIREHLRKFQWSTAEGTVWRRLDDGQTAAGFHELSDDSEAQ